MSKDFRTATAKNKKKKAAAAGGNEKGDALVELVDKQADVGNQEVAAQIDSGSVDQMTELAPEDVKLPAAIRWQLLASRETTELAAMVFAHAQDSNEMTEEMLALATVGLNQFERSRMGEEEANMFGGTSMDTIFDNKDLYEHTGESRHQMFWNGALFDREFTTQTERDSAVAAIKAADQIIRTGNPFMHEFMAFSEESQSPMPDMTSHRSKVQYGKLTFWAFADQEPGMAEQETDADQESEGMLMSMASGDPSV